VKNEAPKSPERTRGGCAQPGYATDSHSLPLSEAQKKGRGVAKTRKVEKQNKEDWKCKKSAGKKEKESRAQINTCVGKKGTTGEKRYKNHRDGRQHPRPTN